MSFVVYGCSYKSAPLSCIERISITPDRMRKALDHLASLSSVLEGAVLSTCNRVEIYAVVSRFHSGVADIRDYLARTGGMSLEEIAGWAYLKVDEEAYKHLFRVAAGLDSMALGETEIQGQIKEALARASEAGTAGRTVQKAFQRALSVGKLVRTRTGISKHPVSISSAAVSLASDRLGGLAGKRAVIFGAGSVGRSVAKLLDRNGCSEIFIASRSEGTARSAAEASGGRPTTFAEATRLLGKVDLAIACTNSSEVLITSDDIEAVLKGRTDRSLLLVDIAVPRDIDPSCRNLDGVELYDIESVGEIIGQSLSERRKEALEAERMVEAEADRFLLELKADDYREVIASLRAKFDGILEREKAKIAPKLASEDELRRAERLARAVVDSLLHIPISRLKEVAAAGKAELLAEALSYLFELAPDSSTEAEEATGEEDFSL
jgi:glutamyl-tRNA reductase